MSATDQTIISAEPLAEASLLIAEAFGLGDDADATNNWPVDDGDVVLAASVSGDLEGSLFLAVNDEVVARITSDPERLRTAFQSALDVMTASLGVQAVVGEVTQSTEAPSVSVEIRDGNKLSALFGAKLAVHIDDPDDPEGPDAIFDGGVEQTAFAADFEPSMLSIGGPTSAVAAGPLNVLHDVEMDVTVELGRTKMPIRELLALQPGMVVEIDRAAGAPIDVLVNGHLIACGEVVVIDEEFGIRITEIVGDGNSLR